MYSFTYKFYPGSGSSEEYEDGVWSYLGALYRNDQIIGRDWTIAHGVDHLECACIAPDKDSLSHAYHNSEASGCLERLIAVSEREPEYCLVGKTLEWDTCECHGSSAYALFTTFVTTAPPVLCIDCGGHVPLYRFAEMDQDGRLRGRIGCWESTYRACDTLYMGSDIGERYGLRQMRAPDSKLSIEGMSICRDLSERTAKPVYYFLFNPRGWKLCPLCGSEWRAGTYGARFDLLCDSCRVVSLTSCET